MLTRTQVRTRLPSWAKVLFERQWRYISARGGRGSAKTESFARALIILSSQMKLRILCGREVQDSIEESVYATLVAAIESLELQAYFDVRANEIRTVHGGKFIFKGLSDLTAASLKSLANIDICWVEEAQALTASTIRVLSPTIRAPGSQIWFSWNAVLETDAIYEAVVTNGLPNCASIFVNFDQNPWFPDELRLEEQHMLATDPIMHRHVWLGEPLPAVEGAIYFDEIAKMEREGRVLNMVHDETLNTYIIMDLGFDDYTSCGVVQQVVGEHRIVDFIENHRVSLKWFSDEFKERGYEGATLVMPHDAQHKTLAAGGTSMKELMESYGWEVEIAPMQTVEDGIRLVRELLPKTYIDKTRCAPLIEHMKRYRRSKTGHPVHDEHSHACDMIRYDAVFAPQMHNNRANWGGSLNFKSVVTV